ncbi:MULTISPECIES: DUF2268 domain-containing protein [unclassified Exiguobacterium]|uniref:DUF2268 domain-containing protein n=1 Tax=unclassified Exiguobacterium TaxID=2644629 RepID=UPI000E8223C0|nr:MULTISPECIES: DUF2268 domain-containing putative Zn-dependent protease [unclassified Exiguobacterium]HAZ39949.1 hypothetical protein [Exiguobacterium sp.]
MKSIYFLCVTLLLASCSPAAEKPKTYDISFTHEKQEIHIVPLYKAYDDYIQAVSKQPEDNEALYKKYVLGAKNDVIKKEQLQAMPVPSLYEQPSENIKDLKQMNTYLKKHHQHIMKQIKSSLLTSMKQLPRDEKLVVFVSPTTPLEHDDAKRYGGVSGVAQGNNSMSLFFLKDFSKESLLNTTAHEYHHTVALDEPNRATMLDYIILEGKAEFFAHKLYPMESSEAIAPLLDHSLEHVISELNAERLTTDDLFFGNYEKQIPSFTKYRLGYIIVSDFVKQHPEISLKEWSRMSSVQILEKSSYKKKLTIR